MGNAGERRTARLCLGADQDVRVGCLARQESDVGDAAPGGECDFLSGIEGTPVDRARREQPVDQADPAAGSRARKLLLIPHHRVGHGGARAEDRRTPFDQMTGKHPDAEKPPASGCWPGCSPQEPEPAKRPW